MACDGIVSEGKEIMPPRKTPEKRVYQPHGHYALHGALEDFSKQEGWLADLGKTGEALQAWQAAIIHDLGGEDQVSVRVEPANP